MGLVISVAAIASIAVAEAAEAAAAVALAVELAEAASIAAQAAALAAEFTAEIEAEAAIAAATEAALSASVEATVAAEASSAVGLAASVETSGIVAGEEATALLTEGVVDAAETGEFVGAEGEALDVELPDYLQPENMPSGDAAFQEFVQNLISGAEESGVAEGEESFQFLLDSFDEGITASQEAGAQIGETVGSQVSSFASDLTTQAQEALTHILISCGKR